MIINNLIKGTFVERPNRFTVIFQQLSGNTEKQKVIHAAHLKDPGRLKELLYPGVELLLRPVPHNPQRKTQFDVIAVFKDNMWVLINSGFHSDLAEELIESGIVNEFKNYEVQKREYTFGKSRLDFLLSPKKHMPEEKKMLLEVKGCTLVENKHACFPDAPTIRGKKHLEELIEGKKQNFDSSVLFLILKEDAEVFSPNYETDPDFSQTLEKTHSSGVNIVPYVFKTVLKEDCLIITPLKRINVVFNDMSQLNRF